MLKDFFEKYSIRADDMLVIACSGGADSMFLLSELLKIHLKEKIIVAHFNHRLRDEESDGDELFVRDFCEANGLSFEVGFADIASEARTMKAGIEEAARIGRYAFLESARNKHNARYILTAHHLDDSIETFMFNLIRGTRLSGLTGIPEQNGYILRPLLGTKRSEILVGLHERDIEYRTDSSNADPKYARNHIRMNILPQFEAINPEYRQSIAGFMQYAREYEAMLEEGVGFFLGSKDSFLVSDFLLLSVFWQREVVRHLYARANNGTIGLSEGNIAEILRFIREAEGGTEKSIKKLRLVKRQRTIFY